MPEFWRRSKPDMSLLRNTASGLRSLFRKEHVDQELDEELRTYLEMSIEEKMRRGMSREDAARAVRLERGSVGVAINPGFNVQHIVKAGSQVSHIFARTICRDGTGAGGDRDFWSYFLFRCLPEA